MATNKKPRKKYVKRYGIPLYTPPEFISYLQGQFADIGLLLEFKIVKGTAETHDVDYLALFFNCAVQLISYRYKQGVLTLEEFRQANYQQTLGHRALQSVIKRYSENKSRGFVATGDEISAMRETYDAFYEPICEFIAENPRDFQRCWLMALKATGCRIPKEAQRFLDLNKKLKLDNPVIHKWKKNENGELVNE